MHILRRAGRDAREIARLTALSFWRGFLSFYNSDNLTYAASIAYYALLSLFPFSLLALASSGARRPTRRTGAPSSSLFCSTFPGSLTSSPGNSTIFGRTRPRRHPRVDRARLGLPGLLRRHQHGGQLRLGRGEDAQLLESQAVLLSDADRRRSPSVARAAAGLGRQPGGRRWFADVLAAFPGLRVLRSLLVQYATTALFIVVVGFVYYFVPNAKVRFRDVWIGALVTGLLWRVALDGFSWFMSDMSRFTRINGSIGVVVVFLVWVYTQAVILLYGVQFTAAYARLRRGRPEEIPAAPAPRA